MRSAWIESVAAIGVFVAGAGSVASAADGDAGAAGLRIAYGAPPACPGERVFVERMRARLAPATVGTPSRGLEVRIAESSGRYVGMLSLGDAAGHTTTKRLEDRDCAELVDALALVAALAMEPEAAGRSQTSASTPQAPASAPQNSTSTPASAPQTSTSTPASAPQNSTSTPQTPASAPQNSTSTPQTPASAPQNSATASGASVPASTPEPRGLENAAPQSTSPGEADLVSSPSSSASRQGRFGVALGPLLALGPAPTALFGLNLSVRWMFPESGVLAPGLEVGGIVGQALDATRPEGTARFRWLTAHAVVDLLRVPRSAVAFRAGLTADVGVLQASGANTTSPASSSRLWTSLGARAALDVPIGTMFAVTPAAGVQAPLRRDTYAFGVTDIFTEPRIVVTMGVDGVACWP